MFKTVLKHTAYYLAVPLCIYLLFPLFNWMMDITDFPLDLGAILLAINCLLWIALPSLVAILMRFSMLPWPVDPFAAAEPPLFICAAILFSAYRRSGSMAKALSELRIELADDGGMLIYLLIGLFIFSLLCSLSLRRMAGDHLPGRIWRFVRRKNAKAEK